MKKIGRAWLLLGALVVGYRAVGCAVPTSFGCVSNVDGVCTCAVGGVGATECEALLTTGAVYACTPDATWPMSGDCICVPYACTTATGDASSCACAPAASLPALVTLVASCPAAAVCCQSAGSICACSAAGSTCASAGLAGVEVASCSAEGLAASTSAMPSCPTRVADAGSDG